jgi:hypothetical protein
VRDLLGLGERLLFVAALRADSADSDPAGGEVVVPRGEEAVLQRATAGTGDLAPAVRQRGRAAGRRVPEQDGRAGVRVDHVQRRTRDGRQGELWDRTSDQVVDPVRGRLVGVVRTRE